MARDPRQQAHLLALEQWLDGQHSDFFFVTRVLELVQRAKGSKDGLRFRQEPSLEFSADDCQTSRDDQGRVTIAALFFGLLGPAGPLPLSVTGRTLRDKGEFDFGPFLDVLADRFFGLFYDAWCASQPVVLFERAYGGDGLELHRDDFARTLAALSGRAPRGCDDADAMPDLLKRQFAGWLGYPTRCPDGLVAILAAWLDVPVAVEEFVPVTARLPDSARLVLGQRGFEGPFRIGRRFRDRGSKVRIRLGPLKFDEFERLGTDADEMARIGAVVKNYLGTDFLWDVRLVLARDEVERMRFEEARGEGVRPPRLGRTAIILSRPPARDVDEVIISPQDMP